MNCTLHKGVVYEALTARTQARGGLTLRANSIVTASLVLSNPAVGVGIYPCSVVAVNSVTGLAAETSGSDQFAKQRAGPIFRIADVLREHL